MENESTFPRIEFNGTLRPSQADVVRIAQEQLAENSRRLHIVAPPGSGKTVVGLYLWAELIKKPCLVLSPNSAIQSQWAARTDLFDASIDRSKLVSTDPENPAFLTSLTYQSVTMPARNIEDVDRQSRDLWIARLLEEQQAVTLEEAGIWIDDLEKNNPSYFGRQLGKYKKKVRDALSRDGESMLLLHRSSQATLQRISEMDVGVIILDECHHLLGHWGRVLSDALDLLNNPIVIGLTATPPDREGKHEVDVQRYDKFFGPVDFEVPVPAVVKDGFLAPYQDLAYFVRPTHAELKFIASADQQLDALVEEICKPGLIKIAQSQDDLTVTGDLAQRETDRQASVIDWLVEALKTFRLPTGNAKDWKTFSKRDPAFALAARQFLASRKVDLPSGTPPLAPNEAPFFNPPMEYIVPVVDRFVRHFLRRSPHEEYQRLAKELTTSLRTLGVQITETGTRACVSPIGRVMAYSQNKIAALVPVLQKEMTGLSESIRAVIIADFERSSAVSAQLKSLMDDESGGAIAAFKMLLTDDRTDELEPILLTGSTILIDDEIEEEFLKQSRKWISDRDLKVELDSQPVGEFRKILGSGRDWAPRVYVEMVTEIFQRGLTKCLIGTRGLLGEGWDANKINVLIDLTTVTTSMSINQLRGRSFRLDPAWTEKLANNWDIVCIAPEFSKGFDDYNRFKKKHRKLFGVTDDGAIEKGVGHVHPAFTEIKPEGLETDISVINDEMIMRSQNRQGVRELWKIGEPFGGQSLHAVEIKLSDNMIFGFPPFGKSVEVWDESTLTLAIGSAVLASLAELGRLDGSLKPKVGHLSGGYVRSFLNGANEDQSKLFADAMKQVMGTLDQPRYIIPRSVNVKQETILSRWLPEIVGKYFVKTKSMMAMYHAVPDVLAKNKSDVAVFEKHWNLLVSPGEAIYTLRGQGEQKLREAKMNFQSQTIIHQKQLFV